MTNELSHNTEQERITVTGEATVSAAPDMVVVTASVEHSAASATQALEGLHSCMLGVVQAIVNRGVAQPDIDTTWIGVYPVQSLYSQVGQLLSPEFGAGQSGARSGQRMSPDYSMYPGNHATSAQGVAVETPGRGVRTPEVSIPPQRIGIQLPGAFLAGGCLRISIRDAKRTGEILDAALAAGAAYCSGQNLRLQDESAMRHRVLGAAGNDARAKAEILASAVGRRLGTPVGVVEEFLPGLGLYGGGAHGQTGGAQTGFNMNVLAASPAEIHFISRVRVTYELM